jgi:hypothetical protein
LSSEKVSCDFTPKSSFVIETRTHVECDLRVCIHLLFFSLSLTGKILYHVVDLFVVHWESLLNRYPRSEIVGTFVPQPGVSKEEGR